MTDEVFRAAFAPERLIHLALWKHWPSVCLGVLGLFFVGAMVILPRRMERVVPLASLAWVMPVYAWAMIASVGSVLTFHGVVSHGNALSGVWALALSQWLGLAAVLLPVAASIVLAGRHMQVGAISLVGPMAAIGAVSCDWVFLLLAVTPMK